MRKSLFSVLALGLAAGPTLPASGAPLGADWPVVAAARDGDCALEVTGNGKFFLIAATGLGGGAEARYRISNGDMTPIDWSIRASDGGRVARYYLPFRFSRRLGVVEVTVSTPDCALNAAFTWSRGIRVTD